MSITYKNNLNPLEIGLVCGHNEKKGCFGVYFPMVRKRRYLMGFIKNDPIRIRNDRERFKAHFKQKPQTFKKSAIFIPDGISRKSQYFNSFSKQY